MNLKETVEHNSDKICAISADINTVLKNRYEIAAAYLLGSVISGQLRNDSDIDIALLSANEQVISMQSRLELAALLELKLGRTIDIGIISSENLIYASEAILKGKRIVTIDKEYTEITEMRLLGCYLVFMQDRKEVEEMYRAA